MKDQRRTALRLARFFGTSERFWMNLQSRYDLEVEKDRLGSVLDEIRPLTAASLRSRALAVHQREYAPSEVFAPVPGVPRRCRRQLSPHLAVKLVPGIRVQPSPDAQPLRRLIPVPAVLVREHHLDMVNS